MNKTPHELRPFMALFDSLLHKVDPVQLWNDFLDMSIGSILVDERLGVPSFGEHHIQRDYDRGVLRNNQDAEVKLAMNEMHRIMWRVIASKLTASQPNKMPADYPANTMLASMSAVKNNTWYDFFGEIHQELGARYSHDLFQPCCASPESTIRYAQLQHVKELDGKPVDINNQAIIANPDCGSGRTTIVLQSFNPLGYYFSMQSTDQLHCKMAVMNLLAHGCRGQVELMSIDRDDHDFIRCWDVNRWLFAKVVPHEVLSGCVHVYGAPKEQSLAWRQRHEKDGTMRHDADDYLRKLQLAQLNRIGLGIGLQASMEGEVMTIKPVPPKHAPLKAGDNNKKGILTRLFAKQREKTKPQAPVAVVPTEPAVPVKRTSARRR